MPDRNSFLDRDGDQVELLVMNHAVRIAGIRDFHGLQGQPIGQEHLLAKRVLAVKILYQFLGDEGRGIGSTGLDGRDFFQFLVLHLEPGARVALLVKGSRTDLFPQANREPAEHLGELSVRRRQGVYDGPILLLHRALGSKKTHIRSESPETDFHERRLGQDAHIINVCPSLLGIHGADDEIMLQEDSFADICYYIGVEITDIGFIGKGHGDRLFCSHFRLSIADVTFREKDGFGEIGILKVVDYINYKGGIRISILCGSRALEDYKSLDNITKEISHTLSSATSEIADNVKRINDSLKNAEYRLIESNKRYLDVVYDQVTEYVDGRKNGEDKTASMNSHIITDNAIILNLDGVDNKSLRDMVNNLKSRYKDCLAGVISRSDKGYFFILGSESIDCRNVAASLREALNAKGGGSAEMIQGNVAEKIGEEDITKILEDVL